MNEFQRLFLVQARSDFQVYEWLQKESTFPECHALHYLQMATEKLGKAHAWKTGPNVSSHGGFVGFLNSLSSTEAIRVFGKE
jgi:hypothetical protein